MLNLKVILVVGAVALAPAALYAHSPNTRGAQKRVVVNNHRGINEGAPIIVVRNQRNLRGVTLKNVRNPRLSKSQKARLINHNRHNVRSPKIKTIRNKKIRKQVRNKQVRNQNRRN